MDLFVVNRHTGEAEDGKSVVVNEDTQMAKIQKKIERRRLHRLKQKEKKQEHLKVIQNTLKRRQQRREAKARIVPLSNEHEQFIDKNFVENSKEEPENIKKTNNVTSVEGFTVLGVEHFAKKAKVNRVLPKWLADPTIISVNLQELTCKVSHMKQLDKDLRNKLKGDGVKYFFPVQAEVIPWLLRSNSHANIVIPQDVCVSAPTGSGKTLVYVLPVVQALKKYTVKQIRALVILPTQDLAFQIYRTFKKYAEGTSVDVCLVSGHMPFAYEQKQLLCKNEAFGYVSKIDILVCTAGRLVDHLKETEGLDLQHLDYLIIDEADRVLDNVQNDWLYHLEKHMYNNEAELNSARVLNLYTLQKRRPPQKLLFSATLSQDPEKLQKLSLFQPKLFTSIVENSSQHSDPAAMFTGKYTTPKELTEKYIICSTELKPIVLYSFIMQEKLHKTIVFTDSVESAHRLAIFLQVLFKSERKVVEISSQLGTKPREVLINDFSRGVIDIIVSTDRLARGMDLGGVQCVISYSPTKYLKTYIHRAGRTARAGALGLTVTLMQRSEQNKFLTLLQQAGKTDISEISMEEDELMKLGTEYQEALKELKEVVEKEKEVSLQKIKSRQPRLKQKSKKINKSAGVVKKSKDV